MPDTTEKMDANSILTSVLRALEDELQAHVDARVAALRKSDLQKLRRTRVDVQAHRESAARVREHSLQLLDRVEDRLSACIERLEPLPQHVERALWGVVEYLQQQRAILGNLDEGTLDSFDLSETGNLNPILVDSDEDANESL